MDDLPMDDVPPCADCTEAEDNDHLNQLANVAVGAAQAAALKRRAESTAGRDVCCVVGCGCAEGLLGVPKAFLAEAPQSRGSGLNASAISSSQNRMCGCSTVHSVRGAGQQWLQHGAECVAWAAHGMPESPHEIP